MRITIRSQLRRYDRATNVPVFATKPTSPRPKIWACSMGRLSGPRMADRGLRFTKQCTQKAIGRCAQLARLPHMADSVEKVGSRSLKKLRLDHHAVFDPQIDCGRLGLT